MSETRRVCGVPSERVFVVLILFGGVRVVMPLAGGGAAMGERGGRRREKPRKIRLWAAHLKSWHGFCFGLRGYHETRAFG
jgi:hypothetical protein